VTDARDQDGERFGTDGLSRFIEHEASDDAPIVALDLDHERLVNSEQGRRGWLREAAASSMSCAASRRGRSPARTERLREAKRRLEKDHRVEIESNAAYEAYRARGVMKDGRRFGRPADPHSPPAQPAGTINTTDHDSRVMRTTGQPAIQGYNAQAAVNENQIIVAAEVTVEAPDFGHLEPMVEATTRELEKVGVGESPETVVADPGYWHKQQMETIVSRGIPVLIPPDSGLRKGTRPGGTKVCARSCAVSSPPSRARRSTDDE